MKFNLKLLESDDQIKTAILSSIIDRLSIVIDRSIDEIATEIKNIVREALKQEPEYSSLISGKLRAEFGIPDVSVVDSIVDVLVDTIEIKKQKLTSTNSGIKGGFTITMMKSDDLGGAIYTGLASVQDAKGYSLPWLEWLTLRGNSVIVKNYSVRYGPSSYSRSGMAIMIPSNTNWRVPPEFAGSQSNNWTTRAIETTEKQIYSTIQRIIEKYL